MMKMKYNALPLSRKHPQGFGYRDYFTRNRHGRSLFEIMKKLALNGPASQYELSSSAVQKTKAATSFGWPQVHKLIAQLTENGLVREYGKQKKTADLKMKGKKQENVVLYGLTDLGILLSCLVSDEVYAQTKNIIREYEKYDNKGCIIGIINLVKYPFSELSPREEIRKVFDPENLEAVKNDGDLYDHFFRTLSWILYDISHTYESMHEVLEKVRNSIKEVGIYDRLSSWLDKRIEILEIELDYFKYTAEWLEEGQEKDLSDA